MSSKASLLKQIIQQLQKFDKETGIIKTKAGTNKKDDGIFVEDTVFVASDNLEILPMIGFYSVPSPDADREVSEYQTAKRHRVPESTRNYAHKFDSGRF